MKTLKNKPLYDLTDSEIDDLNIELRKLGEDRSARQMINDWNCWSSTVDEFLATVKSASET